MPGVQSREGRNWEGCLEAHGWRVFEVAARLIAEASGAQH